MRQLEEYQQLATAASKRSLADYLQFLVVDSRPEARAYRLIAESWQKARDWRLIPAVEQIGGLRKGYSGPRFFWEEYPRGHDKSSGVGRLANWLLAFAPRQNLRIQVAASDKGQAALIADYMRTEIGLNPWLAARLRPHRNHIYSTVNGGELEILAADAGGSYGGKPDLLLADEITHWQNDELWNPLWSGMGKRLDSVVVVTTNSGIKGTWQENVLKGARRTPQFWSVFQADGHLASWMTPDVIRSIAAGLPRGVARRVLENRWVDPGEECGLCTRGEAEACLVLGRRLGLARRSHASDVPDGARWDYVASVDYGMKKDRTVLAIVHRDSDGRCVVDRMDVWQGSPDAPVHPDDVQLWCEQMRAAFGCRFVFDEFQMEAVIRRLEGQGAEVKKFEYRGGRGNYQAASNILGLMRGGNLAWYDGCGDVIPRDSVGGAGWNAPHTLVDEFAECVVKPMSYGWRIDHESGRHDDRVVALAMACREITEAGPPADLATVCDRFF